MIMLRRIADDENNLDQASSPDFPSGIGHGSGSLPVFVQIDMDGMGVISIHHCSQCTNELNTKNFR